MRTLPVRFGCVTVFLSTAVNTFPSVVSFASTSQQQHHLHSSIVRNTQQQQRQQQRFGRTFSLAATPSNNGDNTSSDKDNHRHHNSRRDTVDGDKDLLYRRLHDMRRNLLEEELARAPNPDLSSQEFVVNVLNSLQDPYTPLPDSGFRLLLRASTSQWHRRICTMIGAPNEAPEEVIASALGSALGRPKNQFGILVNAEDAEEYVITFPSDPLDFEDGTCWLECRLRDKKDNRLLVVMGWDLRRRASDGAWLIDGIDWQDFRDDFRPGLGREEWMRICG